MSFKFWNLRVWSVRCIIYGISPRAVECSPTCHCWDLHLFGTCFCLWIPFMLTMKQINIGKETFSFKNKLWAMDEEDIFESIAFKICCDWEVIQLLGISSPNSDVQGSIHISLCGRVVSPNCIRKWKKKIKKTDDHVLLLKIYMSECNQFLAMIL